MSEEWRRGWHPERIAPVAQADSVLVVGGGPAGLEAALTLARAGHAVTLAEQRRDFGGRVAREAQLKELRAWGRVRDYRLHQLQRMDNVRLFADSAIDAAAVRDFAADHVILATGATWRNDGFGRSHFAPIPGFAAAALTPDDVLAAATVDGPVVIYDDDHYYMGNVLALELARRGLPVHLVCPLPVIASWMAYTLEQPRVVAELAAAGIGMSPNAVAKGWNGTELTLARADTGQPLPPAAAATLVFVGARRPDTALSAALAAENIAHRVIGDAEAPGTIQAAVYSGHRHAREVLGREPADRIFRRERAELLP